MSLSGVSMDQWANDILAGLGAPNSPNNHANLNAWQACEGGPATFNPFNTTLPMPGSTAINADGVRNYPSYAVGLDATVRTIRQPNMAPIAAALQADANRSTFAGALGRAPWGTSPSCVGGASGVAPSAGTAPAAGAPQTLTQGPGLTFFPSDWWKGIIPGMGQPGPSILTDSGQFSEAMVRLVEVLAGGLLMGAGIVLVAYSLLGKELRQSPALLAGVAGGAAGVAESAVIRVRSRPTSAQRTQARSQPSSRPRSPTQTEARAQRRRYERSQSYPGPGRDRVRVPARPARDREGMAF